MVNSSRHAPLTRATLRAPLFQPKFGVITMRAGW
jgi:hypothetical protein